MAFNPGAPQAVDVKRWSAELNDTDFTAVCVLILL